MTSPFFNGPIPAYANVPPMPQYYEPRTFNISSITKGPVSTVVTSTDHNYIIGQLVRFLIPYPWAMRQINNQLAYVIDIPAANAFIVDIDSTQFDAFIVSPANPTKTLPQVVAVGDINSGIISQTGRVVPTTAIPGSFINISPI